MFTHLALLAWTFVTCAVAKSDVLDLTQSRDNSFVEKHGTVLVNYGSQWCAHCKMLKPIYEQAATILKDHNVTLAMVDCSMAENNNMCDDIRGWPTLRRYHGDLKSFTDFSGDRKLENIVSFATNGTFQIAPSTTTSKAPETRPTRQPPAASSPSAQAPNSVLMSADRFTAIVKLELPGLRPASTSATTKFTLATAPSLSVLLVFVMRSGHLVLNGNDLALQIPRPSRPQLLKSILVSSDYTLGRFESPKDMIMDIRNPNLTFGTEPMAVELDYALSARNRDDPNIVYYNYHPEIYLDIIGANPHLSSDLHNLSNQSLYGIPEMKAEYSTTLLLDCLSQKTISIKLAPVSSRHAASSDPETRYKFDSITFLDRKADYRAPRPNDRICRWWSWRCADYADPPWYQYIWRANFDEYGRKGCLRWKFVKFWEGRAMGVVMMRGLGMWRWLTWGVASVVILGMALRRRERVKCERLDAEKGKGK